MNGAAISLSGSIYSTEPIHRIYFTLKRHKIIRTCIRVIGSGVSLKERQPSTELRRRLCRGNWGCDEKRQKERTIDADCVKVLGWWWRGQLLSAGRGKPGRTFIAASAES